MIKKNIYINTDNSVFYFFTTLITQLQSKVLTPSYRMLKIMYSKHDENVCKRHFKVSARNMEVFN